MKKQILTATLTALLAASAHGALYTETFSGVNKVILDGNPDGVVVYGAVSGIPSGSVVLGLTVGLNISGGYNGDLYAYLIAPNGTLVVLMNQPGDPFGAGGAGMNITLQNGATDHGSIQNETSDSILSGTYNAAGNLANFNGSVANGTWTLFFADMVPSDEGMSTLNSWSLGITAVPEPVTCALAVFGSLIVVHLIFRRYRASATK